MHSRLAYGGGMPEELVCSKCDLTESCPESPKNLTVRGDDGGTMNHIPTWAWTILVKERVPAVITTPTSESPCEIS